MRRCFFFFSSSLPPPPPLGSFSIKFPVTQQCSGYPSLPASRPPPFATLAHTSVVYRGVVVILDLLPTSLAFHTHSYPPFLSLNLFFPHSKPLNLWLFTLTCLSPPPPSSPPPLASLLKDPPSRSHVLPSRLYLCLNAAVSNSPLLLWWSIRRPLAN